MAETSIIAGAPPPLAPFTHVVIHPDNVKALERQQEARRLSRSERRKLDGMVNQCRRQLDKADYAAHAAIRAQVRDEARPLMEAYRQAKNAGETQKALELRERLIPLSEKFQALQNQLAPLDECRRQMEVWQWLLENDELVAAQEKFEFDQRQALVKESQIFEEIIRNTLTRLGFCYRYTEDGKERVERVRFGTVQYGVDAHYFSIKVAERTAMGGWIDNVPRGVRVKEDLLNPKTLDELTTACRRQVTGVHNPNGAWIVVHRLNSTDGLVNRVRYSDVMDYYPQSEREEIPICIGATFARRIEWIRLSQFPHWLVAGTTGSGKSNFMNTVICNLITSQSPNELMLGLVDLKGGLEFGAYFNVPHLWGEVAQSIPAVVQKLEELEAIMADRFQRFSSVRVKHIGQYRIVRPLDRMPRIVLVMDEVASITNAQQQTKRIWDSMSELVRKGRAVGIHLLLATQRPDRDVLPGQIKAQLDVRLTGHQPSAADSSTILNNALARELPAIPGRMALQYKLPKPIPIQTPFISEQEIVDCLKRAMAYPTPPPLPIPEGVELVDRVWTPERLARLALTHTNGNVSVNSLHKEVQEDLTRAQVRELAEQLWNMTFVIDGIAYHVKTGKGKEKRLVAT